MFLVAVEIEYEPGYVLGLFTTLEKATRRAELEKEDNPHSIVRIVEIEPDDMDYDDMASGVKETYL